MFSVRNLSGSAQDNVHAVIRLPVDGNGQSKEHKSEALTLAPNETRLATVIVGGYAELSNSVAAQIGVEIVREGERVRIARAQNLEPVCDLME